MAITRTTEGTLLIGNLSAGERSIGISDDAPAPYVAVLEWREEGVGMDLTLDEAVAARDELNRLIDRARDAGRA